MLDLLSHYKSVHLFGCGHRGLCTVPGYTDSSNGIGIDRSVFDRVTLGQAICQRTGKGVAGGGTVNGFDFMILYHLFTVFGRQQKPFFAKRDDDRLDAFS